MNESSDKEIEQMKAWAVFAGDIKGGRKNHALVTAPFHGGGPVVTKRDGIFSDDLTNTSTLEYGFYAPANSGAGISLSFSMRKGAFYSVFFTPENHSMAGRIGALRCAAPWSGKANLLRSATMLSLFVGSPSTYPRRLP